MSGLAKAACYTQEQVPHLALAFLLLVFLFAIGLVAFFFFPPEFMARMLSGGKSDMPRTKPTDAPK